MHIRAIPSSPPVLHGPQELKQVLNLGGGLPAPLTPNHPLAWLHALSLTPGLLQSCGSEDLGS